MDTDRAPLGPRMSSCPPMSRDVERAYVAAARAGDQGAMAELVAAQWNYLWSEAFKRTGAHGRLRAEDLVSAGVVALIEAVGTFDLSRGCRLFTHARRGVEEAMSAEVAAFAGAVSVPATTYRKVTGARRRVDVEDRNGSRTAEAALARARMDPATTAAVLAAGRWNGSTTDETADAEGGEAAGVDPLEVGASVMAEVRVRSTPSLQRFLVRAGLLALTERQRRVLDLTVMRCETGRYSDAEAAELLGTSRPTVQRERRIALETLRELLDEPETFAAIYPPRRWAPPPQVARERARRAAVAEDYRAALVARSGVAHRAVVRRRDLDRLNWAA
jgi:RNA polymerase sigma factor (sigma-70 family)